MLNIYPDLDTLLVGMADHVVACAKEAINDHGRFSLVLSGGSSPKKLHELLTTERYRNQIDWTKVYFFFGDERYVPADHPDSNYLMAKKTLFDPLNIPSSQIFRMDTSLTPVDAAEGYEKAIATFFARKPERFDLIILGLGDDAHTASLFPGTSVLKEKAAGVRSLYIEKVKMDRITLSAPLINKAHNVAFLVFGEGKADAVQRILEGERNIQQYPGQLIKPSKGKLDWFMDESAAKKIKR
jgi:6-phosphogluconolactonase